MRTSRLLQDVYASRVAIASVVAWLLIGLASGYATRSLAHQRYEDGRQLTLEKYEQDYEDYKARETRRPLPAWSLAIFAFVFAVIYCLIYEVLRRGLGNVVARIFKPAVPDPPDETGPSSRRRVSPAAIGKLVFVVGFSLLVGVVGARRPINGHEAGRQLTLEEYLADFEPRRQEASRPPEGDRSYLLGGLFTNGAALGLYELFGAVAAAVAAGTVGGPISTGTHVFLSIFGTMVLFVGGVFSYTTLLGVVEEKWLQEVPPWVHVVAFLVGTLLLWLGIHRLFDAIPVRCRECGGKAYCIDSKPWTYECRDCRHVHRAR